MDFLTFLNLLENTIENIDVHGRENVSRIAGIYQAIDNMRYQLTSKEEDDGRQVDIGTDSSNDSKQ